MLIIKMKVGGSMRYIALLMTLAIAFTMLSASYIDIGFNGNDDFNALLRSHDSRYYYSIESGQPLMPSIKYRINLNCPAAIDSVIFIEESRRLIERAEIVAGEDPLPLIIGPSERSKLIESKSSYPAVDYQIGSGLEKGRASIFGYISNFKYENGKVYSRTGYLRVFYTEQPSNAPDLTLKKILVITADSLKTAWEGYRNLYPDYSVNIIGSNEIYAIYPSDTATKAIRKYIQSIYLSGGLEGVILGGDVDAVPAVYVELILTPQYSTGEQTIITDKYYSCLDGDWDLDGDGKVGEMEDSIDIFPDVRVGRVSAKNSAQVLNFINKVNGFTNISQDTIVLVSSYLDANTNGAEHMDNMVKLIPITNPVKKLYESLGNLSSTTFKNAVNESPQFVSHDGHGNYNIIQTGSNNTGLSDIDALTNVKPVFMYSLSCLSAKFDLDCIAEHFLFSAGGGYYLGNSNYGWYTPYFPGFGTGDLCNLRFFNYLLNETSNPTDALYRTFEEFSYEISQKTDWRWQFFTLNFFGDPMVSLNTKKASADYKYISKINKERRFSFTSHVKDSMFVELKNSAGGVLSSGMLYPHDNLFYCSNTGTSDSIELTIRSGDVEDTTICFTQSSDSSGLFVSNYSFVHYKADTFRLNVVFTTDEDSDKFVVKALNSPGDTMVYLFARDTCHTTYDTLIPVNVYNYISFYYLGAHGFSSSTLLPIIIEGDTLIFQPGWNLREKTKLSIMPDKLHYDGMDSTALFTIDYKNLMPGQYDSISVICGADTVSINGYPSPSCSTFFITAPLSTASRQTIDFYVKNSSDSYMLSQTLSCGADLSYCDFENGQVLQVDSGSAYFHKSDNRASSGTYSYFCGNKVLATYPSDYITALYSDSFIYDTTAFLGFDAYVDIEGGMDYLVTYLWYDTVYVPVITLSGRKNSFLTYMFKAPAYSYLHGKNVKLMFEFYSENDAVQYEGVYIDNILVPGDVSAASLSDPKSVFKTGITDKNVTIRLDREVLLIASPGAGNEVKLFDLSGRCIVRKSLIKGENRVKLSLPSGIYFVSVEGDGEKTEKKIVLLK